MIINTFIFKTPNFISQYYFLLIILLYFARWFNKKYHNNHDTMIHMTNIKALFTTMSWSKPFGSKILPFIADNYGYGSGIFYPPLANILPTLFYRFTSLFSINVFFGMKLYYIFITYIAVYGMYILVYKMIGNKITSYLVSTLYLFSPYFSSDIFVRDAIGETALFAVLPFIFLSFYELFVKENRKKFIIIFSLSYIIGIHFHLVSMVYITFFVGLYLVFNIKKVFKKENLLSFVISSFIILAVSSPIFVRLLEHKFNGNYVVFAGSGIGNINTLEYSSLKLVEFVFSPKKNRNKIDVFLNFSAFIMFISSVIFIKKIELSKFQKNLFYYSFIAILILVFMISEYMPWKIMPKFLLNIQFSWRLLLPLSFLIALNAIPILELIKNPKTKMITTIIIMVITIIMGLKNIHFFGNNLASYKNFNWNIGIGYDNEYFPVSYLKNKNYIKSRGYNVLCDKKCNITIVVNNIPDMVFIYHNDKKITVEIPRIYYLGYRIITPKGKTIIYSESKNGFISFNIKEKGTYTVKYLGTKLEIMASIIFKLTIFCGTIILIISEIKYKKHDKHVHNKDN